MRKAFGRTPVRLRNNDLCGWMVVSVEGSKHTWQFISKVELNFTAVHSSTSITSFSISELLPFALSISPWNL